MFASLALTTPYLSHLLCTREAKRATGFVLPLAVSASAVLLLGSASIHTLSLKGGFRSQDAIQREQSADQLRSAAQAFTALASGAEACLLRRPSAEWNLPMNGCLGADPTALLSGTVGDQPWQLISWLPGSESGRLQLALTDGPRGNFRLSLASEGTQILGVSDVQLQGRLVAEALS